MKRGRYASYWNAFLLSIFLVLCYPLKYHYKQVNYIIYCDLDDDDFEAEIPKKGAATDKWEGEDEDDDVKVWKARESS